MPCPGQGRSLPRAASVYADFGAVIGTAKPGRFDAVARKLLGASLIQVTAQDQTGFADMLDHEYLGATG